MRSKVHIGEEIQQQLAEQKRSVNWLAKKISCDPSNLNKKLKCQSMDTHLLFSISKALDVDLFLKFSHDLVDEK